MPKNEECFTKIEAGQILHPESFPLPNELVCIQVPKVFDQVAVRDCTTRTITLFSTTCQPLPTITFEGASDFKITDVRVISRTDSMTKAGYQKIKLAVRVAYKISYSDGTTVTTVPDSTSFIVTVNEIYCPSCLAQVAITGFPNNSTATTNESGSFIKVEALLEAFNDAVTVSSSNGVNYTYTLTLDIGAFFIVKCECVVQLLIPAYGYCPVPPEQQNLAAQSCRTFNDRCRTPFPTSFFPDQKWNPLDKSKKEDWDD